MYGPGPLPALPLPFTLRRLTGSGFLFVPAYCVDDRHRGDDVRPHRQDRADYVPYFNCRSPPFCNYILTYIASNINRHNSKTC